MKFTIKTMMLATLVAAIWCQAFPVIVDIGESAYSIYTDWSHNRIIHNRITVINSKAGRTTWPDRLGD